MLPLLLLLLMVCSSSSGLGRDQASSTSETICPDGWIDADDLGCYMFLSDAVNLFWVEAQQRCEAEGGYLAEPTDARKADFLHDVANIYASMTGIDHWWIGLSDLGKEGHWRWMSSCSPLNESFWAPNHPDTRHNNTQDCAVMVAHPSYHWWQDVSCLTLTVESKKVAPLCQRERLAATCTQGGSLYEGHCYSLTMGDKGLIWDDAEKDCILRGGHLASVHSKAEGEFIVSLANGSIDKAIFLGATDIVSEGSWVWSDGTAMDYQDWATNDTAGAGGDPDGGRGQNCVAVNMAWFEPREQWNDQACSAQFWHVCKFQV